MADENAVQAEVKVTVPQVQQADCCDEPSAFDTDPAVNSWTRPFWRSVFSNAGGGGSVARVCVFLTVTAALGWVTYLVVRHTALPELGGLAVFVSAVVAVVYAPGKIGAIVNGKKG